eukprot:g30.t1
MAALVPELQKRIHELELTVKQLSKDKDELYNDLERNLVRKDSVFWQSSNIHEARLKESETEKQHLQEQLNRAIAQRDSYLDDKIQMEKVKHDADVISKEQIDANKAMERELDFYKRQCAQALEERNAFSSELEELKKTYLKLERDSVHLHERLQTEQRRGDDLENQKDEAVTRVKKLEARLVDCARIPQLEKELQNLNTECNRLRFQIQHIEKSAQVTEDELETTRQSLQRSSINESQQEMKFKTEESEQTGDTDFVKCIDATPMNSNGQVQENYFGLSQTSLTQEVESLNEALDRVMELIPKFQAIHGMLEEAQPFVRGSEESITSLKQIQQAMNHFLNQLDDQESKPNECSNRNSVHVSVGKEAITLASNCLSTLMQSLSSGA